MHPHHFYTMIRGQRLATSMNEDLNFVCDQELLLYNLDPLGPPLPLESQADWIPLVESIARLLLLYFEVTPLQRHYVVGEDGNISFAPLPDSVGVYPRAADAIAQLLANDSLVRNVLYDPFSSALLRRIPVTLISPWGRFLEERLAKLGISYHTWLRGITGHESCWYVPINSLNHLKLEQLLSIVDLDCLLKRRSLFKDELRCLSIISRCERNLMDDKVYYSLMDELSGYLVPQAQFSPKQCVSRQASILPFAEWLAREGKSTMLDGSTRRAKLDYKLYVERTTAAYDKRRLHEKIEVENNDRQVVVSTILNKLELHASQIDVLKSLVDEHESRLRECLSCIGSLHEQIQQLLEPSEGAESPQTLGESPLYGSELCSPSASPG